MADSGMDAADRISMAMMHWKILEIAMSDYAGERKKSATRLMETYYVSMLKTRGLGRLERFAIAGYDYNNHQHHLTRMWLNSTRAVLMILRDTHGPRRAVLRRLLKRMHRTALRIRQVLEGPEADKRQLRFSQPVIML